MTDQRGSRRRTVGEASTSASAAIHALGDETEVLGVLASSRLPSASRHASGLRQDANVYWTYFNPVNVTRTCSVGDYRSDSRRERVEDCGRRPGRILASTPPGQVNHGPSVVIHGDEDVVPLLGARDDRKAAAVESMAGTDFQVQLSLESVALLCLDRTVRPEVPPSFRKRLVRHRRILSCRRQVRAGRPVPPEWHHAQRHLTWAGRRQALADVDGCAGGGGAVHTAHLSDREASAVDREVTPVPCCGGVVP